MIFSFFYEKRWCWWYFLVARKGAFEAVYRRSKILNRHRSTTFIVSSHGLDQYRCETSGFFFFSSSTTLGFFFHCLLALRLPTIIISPLCQSHGLLFLFTSTAGKQPTCQPLTQLASKAPSSSQESRRAQRPIPRLRNSHPERFSSREGSQTMSLDRSGVFHQPPQSGKHSDEAVWRRNGLQHLGEHKSRAAQNPFSQNVN